jgi:glutamate N-acetyltransferase/amino-acid N-acetyltransferase
MFTTNQVCAAPVKLCIQNAKKGLARAVVVNSGNANACTGKQGMTDARRMATIVAEQFGFSPGQVFVGSTGRIGVVLPMANVERGILEASRLVNASHAGADAVAEAIMTSDTHPKQIAIEFNHGSQRERMGGVCKGAGMIQPGMSRTGKRPAAMPDGKGPAGLHATMLCFITTDAAIEAKALQACLEKAVAQSFNRITVDGDMSTNDTVLVLANGLAGNAPLRASTSALRTFQEALNYVTLELARMIVRDGEGVTRFVTVRVNGARNMAEADAAARAVANSALVKTSWFGGDPNWGRIIDALGYSEATLIEERVDIGYSAPGSRQVLWSLKRGQPTRATFKQLCAAVAPKEFDLHINLNLGRASALIYAADLTEDYVEFNKGDVTDPGSLGG